LPDTLLVPNLLSYMVLFRVRGPYIVLAKGSARLTCNAWVGQEAADSKSVT
jgi:hypothetical protein